MGIADCRAAALSGLSFGSCEFGCLGLGSCVQICPQGAISIQDGIAVVDAKKCVGCGLCAKTCPKGIIGMHDRTTKVAVRCSNKNKGPAVKKVCSAGCIGCGICAKQCEQGAVTVEDNLSRVDPEKCIGCGKCVEKCPTKSIRFL